MEWLYLQDGVQKGPVDLAFLKAAIQNGDIKQSDSVKQTGERFWSPVPEALGQLGLSRNDIVAAGFEDNRLKAFQNPLEEIKTVSQARKEVEQAAGLVLVALGLQAIYALFVAPYALIETGVLALVAVALWKWNSRVAAILLFIYSLLGNIIVATNILGITHSGGQNFILALLLLWATFRSIQATFKLHGQQLAEE